MRFCKKLIGAAIVLAFAIFTSLDTHAQVLKILPLGNSITDGDDASHPPEGQRVAYRYRLYTLLDAAGYDFEFVGHRNSGNEVFSGSMHGGIPGTRDQYLVRLLQDGYDERWSQQITAGGAPYLDVYPADMILLHIGTNDITHEGSTSPASVAQILDEINAYELRSGKDVIVIVAMIINRKVYSLLTSQFNNNVAAMVAARNDPDIIMVDMENGAGINYISDIQSDGLHPYPAGYTKMGDKWFEAIQSLNEPPYFTSTPVTSAMEDVTYAYTVTVDDDNPLDNDLNIIAGTKPDWCTFTDNGDNTGLLTGTPGDADIGPHAVSLIVSDGKELTMQDFTIEVANTNDLPRITGQDILDTDEDVAITLTKEDFTIEDDDHPISEVDLVVMTGSNYSVSNNSVTPAKDFYGTLSVNVKATDPVSEGDPYQALVTVNPVNDPPVITGQKSSLEVKQSTILVISVSDLYFEDVDNQMGQLSVIIQPDPDTVYAASGNQLITVKDTIGLIEVRVVLSDGEGTSSEFPLLVNVLPLNSPPQFDSDPREQAFVNNVYFYVVGATDPDGDPLTYRSTMMPEWLGFNTDLKFVGGTPSLEDTGMVWVGIEVTDGNYRVEQLYQLEVVLNTSSDELEVNQVSQHGLLIRNIYPVPAFDNLHLSLVKNGEHLIQVLTVAGRIVYQHSIDGETRSNIDIDINGLEPGVYFIRVSTGDQSDARRFIINR